MVSPLPVHSSPYGERSAAMLLISDPALSIPSLQELLRNLYRLTLAEAQLAQALINGWTLQEFAETGPVHPYCAFAVQIGGGQGRRGAAGRFRARAAHGPGHAALARVSPWPLSRV